MTTTTTKNFLAGLALLMLACVVHAKDFVEVRLGRTYQDKEVVLRGLLDQAKYLEQKFRSFFEGLQAKRPELIKDIRVRGVMVGVELTCDATPIVAECMKRQLLINATQGTVIRLLPALNLSDELFEEGCQILSDVLLAHKI